MSNVTLPSTSPPSSSAQSSRWTTPDGRAAGRGRGVSMRVKDVAKRTLNETQNRVAVMLLRSYLKTFITGFESKMLEFKLTPHGVRLSFPDPAGFEINCATFNSLNSVFCPEPAMVTAVRIYELSFKALFTTGRGGVTFTDASLKIGRMEIEFVGVAPGAPPPPRLPAELEARLHKEWYGSDVKVDGPTSRIADGVFLKIGKLSLLFPGTAAIEMAGCQAVSVDPLGREVGLAECWEEDPEHDSKVVRKQISCEKLKVDLDAPLPLAEGEVEPDPNTAPLLPRPTVRAPFLTDTLVDMDVVLTKTMSKEDWVDLTVAMDNPNFLFMLGVLPVRITTRQGLRRALAAPSSSSSSSSSSLAAATTTTLAPTTTGAAASEEGARKEKAWTAAAPAPTENRREASKSVVHDHDNPADHTIDEIFARRKMKKKTSGLFSCLFGCSKKASPDGGNDKLEEGEEDLLELVKPTVKSSSSFGEEEKSSLEKEKDGEGAEKPTAPSPSPSSSSSSVCPECSASFPDSASLVAHYHAVHPDAASTRMRKKYSDNDDDGEGGGRTGVGGFARGLTKKTGTGLANVGSSIRDTFKLKPGSSRSMEIAKELELDDEEGGHRLLDDADGDDDDFEAAAAVFADGLELLDDPFLDGDDGGGGGGNSTKGRRSGGGGGGGGRVSGILALLEDVEEANNSLAAKTRATLEKVKDVTENTVDNVKDVTENTVDKVKDVTKNTVSNAKNVTQNTLSKIRIPNPGSRSVRKGASASAATSKEVASPRTTAAKKRSDRSSRSSRSHSGPSSKSSRSSSPVSGPRKPPVSTI